MRARTSRYGAQRYTDFSVDLVIKVGERDPDRPIGRVEAAAVQQHDPVVARHAKDDVERMHILLDEPRDLIADALAQPEFQIDQAVIVVEVRPGRSLERSPRIRPVTRRRRVAMHSCRYSFW